ncbi:hypothetical protein [Roseibium aggregatum]|uniref:DUF2185 domain-containing protein n=1 Tax=Roseibium aggregatum TaxID=187304 RepID=A0A939E9T7_9HYPH|nr:hypothetical protein [Roseibium aggregatum]MBN9668973.1 hypothetical protein [Roseibium aggregatum]
MRHNQKVYVCCHVLRNETDIRLVCREDGSWMFLCGEAHTDDPKQYAAVAAGPLLERDETLLEVLDLEENWEAERDRKGGTWVRTPIDPLPN